MTINPLVKDTLRLLIIPAILGMTCLLVGYHYLASEQQDDLFDANQRVLDQKYNLIQTFLMPALFDARFLGNDSWVRTYAVSSERQEHVRQMLMNYASSHELCEQIRIIDTLGNERIRINRVSHQVYSLPEDALQNKSKRPYFKKCLQLTEGDLYFSGFDLNMEHGELERPLKPILRFGLSLFDDEGTLQGVLVINILTEPLLNLLAAHTSSQRGELLLANSDGGFFQSPDGYVNYAHLLPGEGAGSIQQVSTDLWEATQQGQSRFVTDNGSLFAFRKLDLRSFSHPRDINVATFPKENPVIYMLLETAPEALSEITSGLKWLFIGGLVALLLLLFVPAFMLARSKQKESNLLEELKRSNGKLSERTHELEGYRENLEREVERKTRELKSSEAQLKAILDNTPDAMVVMDESQSIVMINHRCLDVFGCVWIRSRRIDWSFHG